MVSSHVHAAPRVWWRRRWLWVVVAPLGLMAGLSWWLTAPLADRTTPPAAAAEPPPVPLTADEAKVPEGPADWPEQPLDGPAAKRLLLNSLVAAAERLNKVDAYTATFHKQERLKGTLGARQTLAIKVRQRPFAIYCKFLTPKPGKEVVFAEGHHDNKVIAHSGGVAGLLVPRLAVAPDHPLALAESRHPITDAGLAKLTAKLIRFRELDLDDAEAVTILDRCTGPDGRLWYRSIHTHPTQAADRPFARVEVWYDPETRLPLHIWNYDWPAPSSDSSSELLLAESYSYDDLALDASLSALDFDPANPAYAFHRY